MIRRGCIFFFFLPECLELLCHKHTSRASSLEMITGNCLCMSALALKFLSEGNMRNYKKLRVVSLSSYVWNCYVMKIFDVAGNDLREFSLNVSLGLENCVMGKNG